MKKFLLSLAIIIGIFIPKDSYADEFREISIEANIDEKGIGHIEETWKINETDTDYTERYKTINNLRGLEIEDFNLEAFGKTFENRDPWDTDLDFKEKAYKKGVIKRDDDEVELCWGISNYSDNTYKLTYKINPLAIGLNDADMVFFTFVGDNFAPEPEKINIKIKGFKPFTDIKFWAFGLKGAIHEENGEIILNSTGDISYTTVMVKFPKETFATSYKEDKSFEDYANKAVKGSKWEEKEGMAYKIPMPKWAKILIGLAIALGLGGIFGGVRAAALYFDEKTLANAKDLPHPKDFKNKYYRGLPYDGHIEDLAYLIGQIPIIGLDLGAAYMNAFILKWAMDGHIDLGDKEPGFLESQAIKILSKPEDMGPVEESLFDMLYQASLEKKGQRMTDKDFSSYLDKNSDDLDNLYDDLEDKSIEALKKYGYIKDYEHEKSFLGSKKTGTELKITDKGLDLYKNILGFKSYLKDYADEGTKSPEEMKNWKDYLLYSIILNVDENFKTFVDQNYRDEPYFIYHPYYFTNANAYSSSINESYASATGFSNAGFGGQTSVGGGGGSFGGGGGGGR
ncbi:DUF2207 domain-containing protein [uncultured Anaerococcus sp.]|uniref:DUF2207 domain-containing protein n=1 Tax=uncultured Anaerococcus sp. TaxID=293428 RepID=UPI00262C092C|nr:DUF2207 domain-containing protein [uncultured Anaerococcus sp.]